MSKFAIATLATAASAGSQLFMRMDENGVAVPVTSFPLQAEAPVTEAFKNGSHQKIIGYFTSWSIYGRNYFPSDIPVDKVDVINYAFANIQGGRVVMGDSYADSDKAYPGDCWNPGCKRGNFNQLNKMKAANPGLRTVISIGGWTWSTTFSDIAATPASRTTFCQSAVDFAVKWGFDGIDLDWEYPVEGGLTTNHHNPADKVNYTALLKELRERLDA
jgi:chitinase